MNVETVPKLTYEDYVLMPEDGRRHEIIDGVDCVVPAPSFSHQKVIGNLFLQISNYLLMHPMGALILSPIDVILSDTNIVQPDLVYVTNGNRGIIEQRGVAGVPDLVVEVLSTNRRHDLITKRSLYRHFAIGEYWIVDVESYTVKIIRGDAETLIQDDAVVTTALFPGLSLAIPAIFQ